MAVVYTKVLTTPTMIKYRVTSAGAEAGNLDAAGAATPDLLTDAKPGSKLRQVLATAVANQAAGRALAFEGSNLQISVLERTAAALWLIDANTDGSSRLRLTMTAAAADAVGAYLTVQLRHSSIR